MTAPLPPGPCAGCSEPARCGVRPGETCPGWPGPSPSDIQIADALLSAGVEWWSDGAWLLVAVDACTCGTPGGPYPHESHCGVEPVMFAADHWPRQEVPTAAEYEARRLDDDECPPF